MSTALIDPKKHRQLFLDSRVHYPADSTPTPAGAKSTPRSKTPRSASPSPNFWVPGAEPPPFTGDSLRAKYVWKDPHDLVFERPVRLKFYLHQARLYAYWLKDRPHA